MQAIRASNKGGLPWVPRSPMPLRLARPPFESWSTWWTALSTTVVSESGSIPPGLLAGMLCHDAEQAFMAGYQLALAELVGGAPGHLRAFAVSEGQVEPCGICERIWVASAGGADWVLTGHKEFVTCPKQLRNVWCWRHPLRKRRDNPRWLWS